MLLQNAILQIIHRRVERFVHGARQGRNTQRRILLEKIRRHSDSDFGRDHGFDEIRTVEDFRRRMPISRYDDYEPYIERVKNGDIQAMFGPSTKVLMFALTTGTTNRSKYIPITQEFFREYLGGLRLFGVQLCWDHRDLLGCKALKIGSDWRRSLTSGGIPCGHITGLVAEAGWWFAKRRYVLPAPVMRIHDMAAKQYAVLRIALASKNIGLIATANPSTLVELARLADSSCESLLRDIHNETLSDAFNIPQTLRDELRPALRIGGRARARELEAIVSRAGHMDMTQVWPKLSTLAVWLGGSVGIYLPQLKKLYGDVAFRDHGLSASEAHMTIPLTDGTSSGLLEYTHHYFEFIPVEERDAAQPTILEAHELQENRDYYILLTTSSGLYRYDIQDVVRCTGFNGEVPYLQFMNKGQHFSSVTGEKLNESQVVAAVRSVFEREHLPLESFTIAPVMGERPRYVMLLEPGSHDGRELELARQIDVEMARTNSEYEERLESHRLEPLLIEPIATGTWSKYKARKTAERGSNGEYKHPCLVNNLDFVDAIRTEFPAESKLTV